jgi:hypothetical protein
MRSQKIAIIDIGDRPRFERSRLAACWAIESLGAGSLRWGDVRSAASRDAWEIWRYLTYPTRVMHVMAHGEKTGSLSPDYMVPFWPWPRRFDLDSLRTLCEQEGRLPNIEVLRLDACSSNTVHWRRGLTQLVPSGDSVVLIGTRKSVSFPEATSYTMSFYSALLSDGLPRSREDLQAHALDAHDRAAAAFRALHGRPTLFRADLVPGRV